jgi:hypothetical protein
MAVEFGILGNVPSAGARFLEGQQAAQAEADRNMLRQMQMEQMVAQRENIMAQREQRVADVQARQAAQAQAARRQEFLSGLGFKMAEGGYKLDRPTLSSMLQFGLQNREDSLIKLATEGLRALDEEDLYQSESTRLGLPGAAAPAAPAAPVGAAPTVAPNAMMAGITREQVQNMLMSPNARIREQGKALASTLEKPERAYEPTELEKLQNAMAALPPGDPRRAAYENRIRMLTTREPKEPREPAAPTVAQIQDPTDPNRMLTVDARRYAGGGVGSPGVIGTSGKAAPIAAADQKKMEGNAQLQTILDTLQTAYADLDAKRAIPSEQRGAISNAWNYLASTGVGQVAGRVAGTQAQTQRDVIQNARNLLFTAVKNATGKTSGELNSNVEFRTWIDALTDPSRSIQANQAILENLEKFVASGGKYSAKKPGETAAPAATPGAAAGLEAERANARAAIAAGAPEAAVRARFKEKTGQEL